VQATGESGMKRFALSIILFFCFTIPVLAEFHRLVSITGGSGQQLSTSLATAGYAGPVQLDELIICNPTGSANTIYIGSTSAVNASTGFPIVAGNCERWRAAGRAIDVTSYFIFSATTQSIAVSLRPR
jgi:hypothetical protein